MGSDKYQAWQNDLLDQIKKPKVLAFVAAFYYVLDNMNDDLSENEFILNKLTGDELLDKHPWWKPYLRHWQLQNRICYMGHVKESISLCVETLSSLEEPVHDGFPQRHCLINDLVGIYTDMDPIGYYDDILCKIDDELAVIPKDQHCRRCFLNCRLGMFKYGGDLAETGAIIDELLVEYSGPGEGTKSARNQLNLELSEMFLARGLLVEASEYLGKVSAEEFGKQFYRAKYYLAVSWLALQKSGKKAPGLVLDRVEQVLKIASDIGSDLLKWKAHRLAGDYFRKKACLREAMKHYAKALEIMDGLGYFRDEAVIALSAAVLAIKTGNPWAAGFLDRASAANMGSPQETEYNPR